MSMLQLSAKQMGDFWFFCNKSVNCLTVSTDDRFMADTMDCVCKTPHSSNFDAMQKRYVELEEWLELAIGFHVSITKIPIGESISRLQAITTLHAIMYNTPDYEEQEEWYQKAQQLSHNWCREFVRYEADKQGAKWAYC